jgi:hypothetical protein
MKKIMTLLLLFSIACIAAGQNSRRGRKTGNSEPSEAGILDSIVNTLFPGPSDQSIFTRIYNKISWYASAIVGSLIAYFTFFRKNKHRKEKINEFLGTWK